MRNLHCLKVLKIALRRKATGNISVPDELDVVVQQVAWGLGNQFCSWPWYQLTVQPHHRLNLAQSQMLPPSLLLSTYRSLLPNLAQPVRLSVRGSISIMASGSRRMIIPPKSSQNRGSPSIHLKATTEAVSLPLELQVILAVGTTCTKRGHKNEAAHFCGAGGWSQWVRLCSGRALSGTSLTTHLWRSDATGLRITCDWEGFQR